jgi:hypothetical protein
MNSPLPAASIAARVTLTLLIATSVLVLLNKAKSGSVSAPQEQPAAKAKPIERKPTRRLFENRIPEHLPIKVKIKREKEKKFRGLENDNWARDMELEVKNVGEKPIYFLLFVLEVPEAKISISHQAFTIMYGRMELADLNNRPNAEDVPIKPGETKVLTIEDVEVRGWDEARARGLVPRIHGVRVVFQDLSFGDGTGFFGGTGAPRPKRNSEPNGTSCLPPIDGYGGSGIARVIGDSNNDVEDPRNSLMPAFSSRHLFYAIVTSKTLPVRNRRRQRPTVIASTLPAVMEGSNRLIRTKQMVTVISVALLGGLSQPHATSRATAISGKLHSSTVTITVIPTIANAT